MSSNKVTTFTRLLKLKPVKQGGSVVIAGGGVSGLSFAYFLGLLRPDLKLTLLERDARLGGYIKSQLTQIEGKNDTILEKGPRTLRGVSTGTLLIADILHRTNNIDVINGVHLKSEGNKKYLLGKNSQGGEPVLLEVPGPGCSMSTVFSFLTSSAGLKAIYGVFKDLFRTGPVISYNPKKDLSVEEFFTNQFGKGFIHEVGSAIMYGIYASDVKDLSVRCVLPKVADIGDQSPSVIRHLAQSVFSDSGSKADLDSVKERGSQKAQNIKALDPDVQIYAKEMKSELNMINLRDLLKRFPMLALKGGLETIPRVLANNLPANVNVLKNEGLVKVTKKSDQVIVTTTNGKEIVCDHLRTNTSPKELTKVFSDSDNLRSILSEFKHTSVSVVNVYIRSNVKAIKGFGFLIPKALFQDEVRLMGVIFDSDVESSAKPIFNSEAKQIIKNSNNIEDAKLKNLALQVFEQSQDVSPDYTKVTFMFNINPATGAVASDSKLKYVIKQVFSNQLHVDLDHCDWFMERSDHWEALPLYDVEFLYRKQRLMNKLESEFGSSVSLGGMAFSQGVGVPDCIVTSFKDSLSLSK